MKHAVTGDHRWDFLLLALGLAPLTAGLIHAPRPGRRPDTSPSLDEAEAETGQDS